MYGQLLVKAQYEGDLLKVFVGEGLLTLPISGLARQTDVGLALPQLHFELGGQDKRSPANGGDPDSHSPQVPAFCGSQGLP